MPVSGETTLLRKRRIRLMLLVAMGALAIYVDFAFGGLRAKTGFVFLVVPFASWLLVAIVLPTAALISRRQVHRGDRA